MKNNIISIILFIALMFFVFFAKNEFSTLCTTVESSCSSIENLIVLKDYTGAYTSCLDLIKLLEEHTLVSSTYVNHTDIEILLNNAVTTAVYIRCNSPIDALATLDVLRTCSKTIREIQEPTLSNIF